MIFVAALRSCAHLTRVQIGKTVLEIRLFQVKPVHWFPPGRHARIGKRMSGQMRMPQKSPKPSPIFVSQWLTNKLSLLEKIIPVARKAGEARTGRTHFPLVFAERDLHVYTGQIPFSRE